MSDELRGTVLVEFSVRHRLALSIATEGWSAGERQALLDGDDEAMEALVDAVWLEGARHGFDDVDDVHTDLRVGA